MGAIYKECVGCNLRHASIDEDLCDTCYNDYQPFTEYEVSERTAKGGKGRVPMPPPGTVMEDSRTNRTRSRGDIERAAIDDLCGQCGGSGSFNGATCRLCGGDGYGDDATDGVDLLKSSDVCLYCNKVLTPEEQTRVDGEGYPLEIGSCDSCAAPYVEHSQMAEKLDAKWAEYEDKARRGEHCYGCGTKFDPPYTPGQICADCSKIYDDRFRELHGREPQEGDEF